MVPLPIVHGQSKRHVMIAQQQTTPCGSMLMESMRLQLLLIICIINSSLFLVFILFGEASSPSTIPSYSMMVFLSILFVDTFARIVSLDYVALFVCVILLRLQYILIGVILLIFFFFLLVSYWFFLLVLVFSTGTKPTFQLSVQRELSSYS